MLDLDIFQLQKTQNMSTVREGPVEMLNVDDFTDKMTTKHQAESSDPSAGGVVIHQLAELVVIFTCTYACW